jgi:hypothetical protein
MELLRNDKKTLWTNLFSLALILVFLAGNAFAADSTWNGGTGNWNVSTNWSPSGVPNGSSYNVFIDGGNTGINSFVNLNMSTTIGNLTVDTGDTLDIDNSRILTMGLDGGSITNNGILSLNATTSNTHLRVGAANVLLTGTGILTLSNDSNNFIDASTAGNLLTNDTKHTIQGSGNIGNNTLNLTNLGTITANQDTDLIIDPNVNVTNQGILQATSGATLQLKSGTYNNTGGTIQALDGSAVELSSNPLITGGTLTTSGTGVILSVNTPTLQNLTNAGQFEGANGSITYLKGTITNTGKMSLTATSSNTHLRVADPNVLLTGTGTLTLSNDSNNFIDASTAGNLLTNDTNHTIQGSGNIGNNTLNLTNLGTIIANQSTSLTIDPNSGVTNSGTFRANSGSTLIVTDNLTNYSAKILTGGIYDVAGTMKLPVPTTETIVTNAATIILDGDSSAIVRYSGGADALAGFATNAATGAFTIKSGRDFTTAGAFSNAGKMTFETGSDFTVGASQNYIQTAGLTTVNGSLIAALVDIQAGILKGSGTITGNVAINGGTVQPGNSPGIMNISGNYTQTEAGILEIEILNKVLASGGYDQLSITGTASLAGTLNVSLLPGAVISDRDTFDIIQYASRSGTFSNYVGPFDNSQSFYFTYEYLLNDMVLTAHGAVPLPPSLLLFGSGLLSIGFFMRKKFKRQ